MRYRTDHLGRQQQIAHALSERGAHVNRMEPWGGHLPITTTALLSIFDSWVAGSVALTVSDRVLYTACEIRCAVATRSLVRRIGDDNPLAELRAATDAFVAIGASQFVRDLRRAADDFSEAATASRRRNCLAILEDRLLCTEDPIDVLIAQYAWRCLKERTRASDQPSFAAPRH